MVLKVSILNIILFRIIIGSNLNFCRMKKYLLSIFTLFSFGLFAQPANKQFVLFDVEFTYTKDEADSSKPSKSHFSVSYTHLDVYKRQV